MKIDKAVFQYTDKAFKATVTFNYKDGTPTTIEVEIGVKKHKLRHYGEYKPCMTHVQDLIGRFADRPAKSEFAKQREAKLPMPSNYDGPPRMFKG